LSRWPNQEQVFRNARNGGGIERTHGFGGAAVAHVALETKRERAERRVASAEDAHAAAQATHADIVAGPPRPTSASRPARREVCNTERELERRRSERDALASYAREIFVRDTGRDSIMTCLKLSMLALIEYAMQEFFGGLSMEWRTFIEQFVMLPVTVRTSSRRVLYQIHANPRKPKRMAQLAAALEEINRRRLHRGKQLLVYELVDPSGS